MGILTKVLASVGLATSAQLGHAARKGREAAEKAEGRVAKLRADLESWKTRQQEAADSAAQWKKAASEAQAALERARRDADAHKGQAEHWKARADSSSAQIRELKERLDETRRVTTVARQHLMATETKLDLIETAIQVLDARTRDRALGPGS